MIRLDIFSDPVCPWCLIGKTYLDRALESRPDHPFQIAWHPFQLKPDMPKGGVGHVDYLAGKFGGKERAIQMMLQVADHADGRGDCAGADRGGGWRGAARPSVALSLTSGGWARARPAFGWPLAGSDCRPPAWRISAIAVACVAQHREIGLRFL